MDTHDKDGLDVDSAIEQRVSGNWKQFSGRVQEAWGVLTQDDTDKAEGRLDQLIGTIQEKTGESRQTVSRKLRELALSIES